MSKYRGSLINLAFNFCQNYLIKRGNVRMFNFYYCFVSSDNMKCLNTFWNAMCWSCVFSCSMSMFWGDAEARVFVQLVPVQGADMPCKRHGQPLQQPQLRKQFGNAQQVFQHIQPTWLQGKISELLNIIYKILFALIY